MKYAPKAFRLVDLDNQNTWANAPLGAWLKMRATLVAKRSDLEQGDTLRAYVNVVNQAVSQMNKEARAGQAPTVERWTGSRGRRLYSLVARLCIKNGIKSPLLTTWEMKFLRRTEWFGSIELARSATSEDATAIRFLLACCLKCEEQYKHVVSPNSILAQSQQIDDAMNIPVHGRKVYLPNPIELVQLRQLVHIFMERLREGARVAEALHLRPNRYGLSFKCPRCRTAHYRPEVAESCCGIRQEAGRRRLLRRAIPIYGNLHEIHVSKFLHLIWRFAYETAPDPGTIESWPKWKEILSTPPDPFERAFLGFIFKVEAETIRRRLTHGVLEQQYDAFAVAPALRVFRGRNQTGVPADIRVRGWYLPTTSGDLQSTGACEPFRVTAW